MATRTGGVVERDDTKGENVSPRAPGAVMAYPSREQAGAYTTRLAGLRCRPLRLELIHLFVAA